MIGDMPKKPAERTLKPETREARRMFLYGDGNGNRIISPHELAKRTGVHVTTIWRNLPAWEKEYVEILAGQDERSLAISLSAEQLQLHKSCINTVEEQLRQCQWELDRFDEITAKLESICENFSLNTENGDAALRLLENYLASRGTRDNLRKTFLTMHKHYTDLTGVRDLLDVQAVAAKELEKGRVRQILKREAAEGNPRDVTPPGEKLAVFDR